MKKNKIDGGVRGQKKGLRPARSEWEGGRVHELNSDWQRRPIRVIKGVFKARGNHRGEGTERTGGVCGGKLGDYLAATSLKEGSSAD